MHAQGNKAAAYSGHENFDFTIIVPLKILPFFSVNFQIFSKVPLCHKALGSEEFW